MLRERLFAVLVPLTVSFAMGEAVPIPTFTPGVSLNTVVVVVFSVHPAAAVPVIAVPFTTNAPVTHRLPDDTLTLPPLTSSFWFGAAVPMPTLSALAFTEHVLFTLSGRLLAGLMPMIERSPERIPPVRLSFCPRLASIVLLLPV